MGVEVQFYTVDGKGPKWIRSAGISGDGTVFVPAAISGNEKMAFLNASFDGEKACINHEHIYLPSVWMKKEYPKESEMIDMICNRMSEISEKALDKLT